MRQTTSSSYLCTDREQAGSKWGQTASPRSPWGLSSTASARSVKGPKTPAQRYLLSLLTVCNSVRKIVQESVVQNNIWLLPTTCSLRWLAWSHCHSASTSCSLHPTHPVSLQRGMSGAQQTVQTRVYARILCASVFCVSHQPVCRVSKQIVKDEDGARVDSIAQQMKRVAGASILPSRKQNSVGPFHSVCRQEHQHCSTWMQVQS